MVGWADRGEGPGQAGAGAAAGSSAALDASAFASVDEVETLGARCCASCPSCDTYSASVHEWSLMHAETAARFRLGITVHDFVRSGVSKFVPTGRALLCVAGHAGFSCVFWRSVGPMWHRRTVTAGLCCVTSLTVGDKG